MQAKPVRYTMFGLLYFTQGTILSYFTALNALYFLSKGLTMTSVGIFATIALIPFVIKIFLGMLSDRVNLLGMGHRKPYILVGLVVQTVCCLIAPFIDLTTGYWWFVALAFVLQMGMALYDTCTDGLALDTTPLEEKGIIQGFMVGGRALGVVLTASVVGILAETVSWQAVFWLLAGLTLLPIPLVLMVREGARPVERTFNWKAFGAFKRPEVAALAAVGLLFFIIIAGANQMVNPFLTRTYGINLSQAGMYTTVWGIGAVLGGVGGGWLIRRIGDRRGTLIALGASLVSVLALAAIGSPEMAWPIVFIFGVTYSSYQTIYFALSMGYTDLHIAASMFAILMAMSNIGQGIGMGIGGALADGIGFRWTFVILALLNLLALPLLPLVFRRKKQGITH